MIFFNGLSDGRPRIVEGKPSIMSDGNGMSLAARCGLVNLLELEEC